jgi:hypothetical protein
MGITKNIEILYVFEDMEATKENRGLFEKKSSLQA